GFFGCIVWDLQASKPLRTPIDHFEDRKIEHKFVTSSWLEFKKESSRHVLVLGALNGQIIAWDLSQEEEVSVYEELQCTRLPALRSPPQQPVLSLDTHISGESQRQKYRGQVVASFADRTVKSWTLTRSGGFNLIFSMQFATNFLPKNVRIHYESRNIYAFALEGGKCALLHGQSGTIITSIENGCEHMLYVALDQYQDRLLACTGDGYQLFRTSDLCHVRTFEDSGTLPIRHACQVAFVENGRKTVAGTDQGKVLIFDSDAGHLEQTLMHPRGKMVQTVATCTVPTGHYVAMAGSSSNSSSDVVIWRKKVKLPPSNSKTAQVQNKDPVIFQLHRSTARLSCYVFIGMVVAVFAIVIGLTKSRYEVLNI
ncbi:WD40-repeat-containing domain protein, partial [Lentinula raphanica]